jgi:hypothetical protein
VHPAWRRARRRCCRAFLSCVSLSRLVYLASAECIALPWCLASSMRADRGAPVRAVPPSDRERPVAPSPLALSGVKRRKDVVDAQEHTSFVMKGASSGVRKPRGSSPRS